ncbi:hypothetical protein ALC57_11820, partial [Trachymyrmex cornetzi]
ETLPDVLCHCGIHSAAIQLRHNAVLHRLWKATRLPEVVRVNQRVEGVSGDLAALRPDFVVRHGHEPSKSVVICDVTVPFENRWVSFEEARARKLDKRGARVQHPLVPCSFPSLWGSSFGAANSGSSMLARRGEVSAGCGASRLERCECRVICFVFVLASPFQLSRESVPMFN